MNESVLRLTVFQPKHESIPKVSRAPLMVPIASNSSDLNALINHLANKESFSEDIAQEYVFFIHGRRLNVAETLAECLLEMSLEADAENILVVEYGLAEKVPSNMESKVLPDWIRVIHQCRHGKLLLSGCYDGVIRSEIDDGLFTEHGSCITGLTTFPGIGDGCCGFASASNDMTVRTWKNSEGVGRMIGIHGETIQALETIEVENQSFIVSGDYGGNICAWSLDSREKIVPVTTNKKSKKKPHKESNSQLKPLWRIEEAHKNGPVSAISTLSPSNPKTILTCGWDKTLKIWSLTSSTAEPILKSTTSLPDTPTCMSIRHDGCSLAFGHPDGSISIWKCSESAMKLLSRHQIHRGWISSLAWSPTSLNLLVTASHDGSVAVWDTQSLFSGPLKRLVPEGKGKILAVAWCTNKDCQTVIYAGGEDCILYKFT